MADRTDSFEYARKLLAGLRLKSDAYPDLMKLVDEAPNEHVGAAVLTTFLAASLQNTADQVA